MHIDEATGEGHGIETGHGGGVAGEHAGIVGDGGFAGEGAAYAGGGLFGQLKPAAWAWLDSTSRAMRDGFMMECIALSLKMNLSSNVLMVGGRILYGMTSKATGAGARG